MSPSRMSAFALPPTPFAFIAPLSRAATAALERSSAPLEGKAAAVTGTAAAPSRRRAPESYQLCTMRRSVRSFAWRLESLPTSAVGANESADAATTVVAHSITAIN